MRRLTGTCLGVALMLLANTAAQARVSHGYSGVFALGAATAVNGQNRPLHSSGISRIRPNPATSHTTIEYELPTTNPIRLEIFDLCGCRVRVLDSGTRPSGSHQMTWDGRDDAGRAVPTGTYFCRLTTPQRSHTKKLVVTR